MIMNDLFTVSVASIQNMVWIAVLHMKPERNEETR
jgi:hypothetical protein